MDLNNLITTIISSTAALVAIIGGFLVSRVISISSEQSGIKRKIREIDNDIFAKKELVGSIDNYLFEDDLKDFVTKTNIKRMIEGKSLVEIIEEDEYTYLTNEELEPYFKQLQDIKNELLNIIKKSDRIFESFSDLYKEFDDLKHPERRDWYQIIFEAIDELTQPEPTDALGFLSGMKYRPVNVSNFTPNTDYKENQKERSRILDEIRILKLQKQGQLKILDDYGKPKWIWSGLVVLVYASIVGIIYPSTLLPYPKETYNDGLTKWFILNLFYSQLLLLFIYLGFAMYKLTRTEEDSEK